MTTEIDDLPTLWEAMHLAAIKLQDNMGPIGALIDPSNYTPGPDQRLATLDAWADYRIAKRRYERALMVSLRGSAE